MGIVGPILLLGGAIYVFSKRCELLGLCGDIGGSSGDTSSGTDVAGNTDESASNLDANGNFDTSSGASCCHCEMQGDRVKCQKHGGAWYNPPALNGVSNDQSVELSLAACNATCGSNSTSQTDRDKNAVKGVKCAAGYSSVNGKCVKLGPNRTKGGAPSGGSRLSPKPAAKSTPQKITPKPGSGYDTYFKANPKGYKPGGGTYYTARSYFVDPYYVRPFTLYHRIAN